MITVLCGGVVSLRLVRGLRSILPDAELAAVVTTGDALWMSGAHLAQTLDAAVYLFAGIQNLQRGFGIRGDTHTTRRFLEAIGRPEAVTVGDKERAVQIARAEMLRAGLPLTAATELIAGGFGITATVLPATDDEVSVVVESDGGPVPLAVFRELADRAPGIAAAGLRYAAPPKATPRVLEAIGTSDAVILGPDPPLSGMQPVLVCEGIREALADRFVIAVSPFGGGRMLPAYEEAFFRAEGLEPASAEVAALYGEICELFVQDRHDPCPVEGALMLDTRCASRGLCESLAWDLMAIVRRSGKR
jgi:LPPG:FO 2-phospho-L-lactate transferase